MTLQTPFHIQRCELISERHQIDTSVTSRAADALVHVDAVVEVNEVGQIMHSSPLDWFAGAPALANWLEIRAGGPNLRMTIHAGLCRGYSRICELLDGGVAIAAIDTVIAGVMFMAELNGLLAREVRLSVIRRPVEFEQQPDDYRDEEDRAEDADFGYEVSASMKDLAHLSGSIKAVQAPEHESSHRC